MRSGKRAATPYRSARSRSGDMTVRWRCGRWDRSALRNGAVSHLRCGQIFDLDAVAVLDAPGHPPPVTMLMIALVAEDADRAGLLDQRRQLVEFLPSLRRFEMLRIDL